MMASVFRMLLQSKETDPLKLSQTIWEQPSIHLHGPEHHIILPCVLLTAFHNNGGDINLKEALKEANIRGKQVPGGACGFWGVCGAAIGAGIYASIVTNSNPLNASAWSLPQILSSRCLAKMAEVGGPRCCKRTSRIAVSEAIKFTKEHLGVTIPEENLVCTFIMRNKECLKTNCPYYDLTTPQAVFL